MQGIAKIALLKENSKWILKIRTPENGISLNFTTRKQALDFLDILFEATDGNR